MPKPYDAILVVSFGGPEKREDVIPFLENVLRGRNVPSQRMLEVAEHYYHFNGVSPINQQNRAMVAALKRELTEQGPHLPIYWGNRNWHPLLKDALRQMKRDGVQRALAFVTSTFSSYSGCRQYREDIERARIELGSNPPEVYKLRSFFNHPGFIESMAARVREALETIPSERQTTTQLVYTAHSIPMAMADGCDYVVQLGEASRLVSKIVGRRETTIVYQSRSGLPSQPWLEPDVCDYLNEVHKVGKFTDVVLVPIGFISDHMEVLFDLDTEARELCDRLDVNMVRAKTVGTHAKFISMIRELILERTANTLKRYLGTMGPCQDVCLENCCPSGRSPMRAS